jgi:hypothetical protein
MLSVENDYLQIAQGRPFIAPGPWMSESQHRPLLPAAVLWLASSQVSTLGTAQTE